MPGLSERFWSWVHGKKAEPVEPEWERRHFPHTVDPQEAANNAKHWTVAARAKGLFDPASRKKDDKIRDAGELARTARAAGFVMTRRQWKAIADLEQLEQEEREALETRKRRPNTARVSFGRTSDAALPTNTDLRTLQIRF